MKKLVLLLFFIIVSQNCLDITNIPIKKAKGHCIKNDYIFTFNDSINRNNELIYEKKSSFDLLIDKDTICECKVNKKIYPLNLYEIQCKIEN